MRKMHLTGIFVLLCLCTHLSAQSLYPVSLEEKVNHSDLIVEGKVISQESFWNTQHTMIFTSHVIEVTKVFKGVLQEDEIEILTVGGTVGTESIEASDLLTLSRNETGIFFCHASQLNLKSPSSGRALMDVYAGSQGFLSYEIHSEKASAPFARYESITDELYPLLQSKTGRSFTDLNPDFNIKKANKQLQPLAVSISGFSPATVNAGALLDPSTNLLTISGSGFGTPSGSAAILFDDANDGVLGTPLTITYNDPHIISWTDAQIQVRVPSRVGTGNFDVRDASGSIGSSPGTLNVLYSILTSTFSVGPTVYVKEANLMNANGAGGYTILYSTSTAGSGVDYNSSTAKNTFQRALATWKEISGYNVVEGGTTTIQLVSGDGSNVVMFDNANTGTSPLPAGVLAVCYSYYSICTADPVNYQARKTGFDIVVRNSGYSTGTTSFAIGPCPPLSSNTSDIDLETVILHELGHSLNLGHINDTYTGSFFGQLNPGKLMNFAVVNSVKRVSPDYSAKAGAAYAIMPQGNTYGNCTAQNTEMIPLSVTLESKDDCPLIFPSLPTPQNTTVVFDLAHSTSNKFVDPSYTQLRCDGNGASLTNNAYYALMTNNTGGSLMLSVTGYTTNPSALTSCAEAYSGIPVTGVRLALYQTSSCPAAGSFGTPVACRSFSGDGSLTAINGLLPNTNYLLMVEGIENTKAVFNLVFSGAALPIRLSDFSGTVMKDHNLLSWKADMIQDVEKMILQKSSDGTVFENLSDINTSNWQNGEARDNAPFDKTFYRLKIINTDGSTDFSKVIYLQRTSNSLVQVYPNPVKNLLNIRISNPVAEPLLLRLYNSSGQLVAEKTLSANTLNSGLSTSHLSNGVYQLIVASTHEVIESKKILIKK